MLSYEAMHTIGVKKQTLKPKPHKKRQSGLLGFALRGVCASLSEAISFVIEGLVVAEGALGSLKDSTA